MAFRVTTYVDPGVYVRRILLPGAVNVPAVPFTIGIVGIGSRTKRVSNETVTRGLLTGETLTVAGSPPHTATLANRSTRRLQETTVYQDGVAIADALVSYQDAFVEGNTLAARNFTTNNALVIEMDGHVAVTIRFVAAGAAAVTIAGTQIDLTTPAGGTIAAITTQ
jgi:hypothetical protein